MFKLYSTDDGRIPPIEYVPCSAFKPVSGLALTLSSGKLSKASGKVSPIFISAGEATATVTNGTIWPVIRITSGMIFETTASADMSDINIGDKVTLATDGLRVTATTTETVNSATTNIGVAEIVSMSGTDSGSKVLIKFC